MDFILAAVSGATGGIIVAVSLGLYGKARSPIVIAQNSIKETFPDFDERDSARWVVHHERLRYERDGFKVATKGLLRREVWSDIRSTRDVILMVKAKP